MQRMIHARELCRGRHGSQRRSPRHGVSSNPHEVRDGLSLGMQTGLCGDGSDGSEF
jgi:hypothetical protein